MNFISFFFLKYIYIYKYKKLLLLLLLLFNFYVKNIINIFQFYYHIMIIIIVNYQCKNYYFIVEVLNNN